MSNLKARLSGALTVVVLAWLLVYATDFKKVFFPRSIPALSMPQPAQDVGLFANIRYGDLIEFTDGRVWRVETDSSLRPFQCYDPHGWVWSGNRTALNKLSGVQAVHHTDVPDGVHPVGDPWNRAATKFFLTDKPASTKPPS